MAKPTKSEWKRTASVLKGFAPTYISEVALAFAKRYGDENSDFGPAVFFELCGMDDSATELYAKEYWRYRDSQPRIIR